MKLSISKLLIRNFRSLGDNKGEEVIHEVDLLKRGPVLICGMNGAGKTSVIEAIIWCLFGKMSDNQNPGDNIINWDAGRNCMVTLVTSDGYEICRTRKYEGYSDLLIKHNGQEIEDGDSTNANAQVALNNLFDLDFNSFVSSLFFGQASGSFLTLSDTKKKLVIEDLFGLSKLTYYAKIAKERINKCSELHTDIKTKISDIDVNMSSIENEINRYQSLSSEFEVQRKESITNQSEEINKLKENQEELIEINKLESSWGTINKGNEKIKQFETQKDDLNSQLNIIVDNIVSLTKKKMETDSNIKSTQKDINQLQEKIKKLEEKQGTVCPTCEQNITKTHINKKIKKIEKENNEESKQLKTKISEYNNSAAQYKSLLESQEEQRDFIQAKTVKIIKTIKILSQSIEKAKKDKMTITEAIKHNALISNTNREINKCEKLIKEEKEKKNNYNELIKESREKIENKEEEKQEFQERCESLAEEATHLTYIYRAHSDKKNLRSFLISGSIPILNNRLSYYFNELNIQSDIRFNQMLQIKSNKWPYSLHSGGEKKRVDLALMCALYDTFTSIYGQKCNILVLDELDKEFDKDGVDEYIRLVIDDLSSRIDTILVISHKDEIQYAFPTQIKLTKENDMSYLEQ